MGPMMTSFGINCHILVTKATSCDRKVIQSVDLDLLVKFMFEATRGSHWPNGGFSMTLTVSTLYSCSYHHIASPPTTPPLTAKEKPLFHPQSEPRRRKAPRDISNIFPTLLSFRNISHAAKTYPRAKLTQSIHIVIPFSSSAAADESVTFLMALCTSFVRFFYA